MKDEKQPLHPLLQRMGQIERMERGRICRLKGRPHYNHQTWRQGRNIVRYVPACKIEQLQEAIDGYRLYMQLAQRYADQIIQRTRRQDAPPTSSVPRTIKSRRPKSKDV